MFSEASSSTRIGLKVFGSPCRQKCNSAVAWPRADEAKHRTNNRTEDRRERHIMPVPPMEVKRIGSRSRSEPEGTVERAATDWPTLLRNPRIRATDFPTTALAPSHPDPACSALLPSG